MMGDAQGELYIYDPFEPRRMPQTGGAWFTLDWLEKRTDAHGKPIQRMRERRYRLRDFVDVITATRSLEDTYVSQCTFSAPRRRVVLVDRITHCYVDLDVYNIPELAGLPPSEIVQMLIWHCEDEEIPLPSVIISSGRGLYCKWFFEAAVDRSAAGRVMQMNRTLVKRLAKFGADPAAVDLARILRVCGTTNSKNGRRVEIVYLAGTQDDPRTYDFDMLAAALLPPTVDREPAIERPSRIIRPSNGRFTWGTYYWGVYLDLCTLARMRYPNGIVTEGARDTFGHLAGCALAHVVDARILGSELQEMTSIFLPPDYLKNELLGNASTLLSRAADAAAGRRVEIDGWNRGPAYGYGTQRMIDKLQVIPSEMPFLCRLISSDEKYRRKVGARRAAGVIERQAYLAQSAARAGQARELRSRGMTLRAIAAELSLSKSQVQRLLSE